MTYRNLLRAGKLPKDETAWYVRFRAQREAIRANRVYQRLRKENLEWIEKIKQDLGL